MTQLIFNNDTRNPGFKGNLTSQEAQSLAQSLDCTRDTSSSIPNDQPCFSTPDESIMIETGYGVSCDNDLIEHIKSTLKQNNHL